MEKMTLDEMINKYGKLNKEATETKKEADKFNKAIKAEMKDKNLDEFETDLWKVKYQIRKSESLDEEKVIKILKSAKLAKNIVKNKPYIDEDALENAIYTGVLPQDILLQIQACRIVKETVALTIKEN